MQKQLSNLAKLFLLILFLSPLGCWPVKTTPPTTYLLTATPTQVPVKRKRTANLMVMMPDSMPAYNTTQMAYTPKYFEIAYFAKNRWAETPAQMLQNLLVKTLQRTHHFHAVVTPPLAGKYDYILTTQVLELIQDYTTSRPVLRMSMRAQLIKNISNKILASKEFHVTELIPVCTPYGGVIAANYATQRILRKIAYFSLRYT